MTYVGKVWVDDDSDRRDPVLEYWKACQLEAEDELEYRRTTPRSLRKGPFHYCWNCKLYKPPLRSSGRCEACEKFKYLRGVERPVELILKEVKRIMKDEGLLPVV